MYYNKRHSLKYQLVPTSSSLFLDKVTKEDIGKNLQIENSRFFSRIYKYGIETRSLNYKYIIISLPKYKINERALLLLFANF